MKKLPIDGPDGPTLVRFSQAANVDAVSSDIEGRISRVALFPS